MSRKDFGLRHIAGLLTLVAVAAAVMLVLAGSAFSDPPLSGAIFTTDSSCSVVNGNIYMDKTDVYLNGGPSHPGAAGLPDGSYYVQITDPSGATVLGTSVSSANETPVTVSGGNFASCYELWNILIKGSDGTPGYDDSPNNGGEYKVWVSNQADFANDSAKTDNFKVRNGGCGDVCVPVQATLSVSKFYDRNGNGINDDGQPITGWQFNIDGGAALTTPWSSLVNTGTHTVTEANAVQAGWVPRRRTRSRSLSQTPAGAWNSATTAATRAWVRAPSATGRPIRRPRRCFFRSRWAVARGHSSSIRGRRRTTS